MSTWFSRVFGFQECKDFAKTREYFSLEDGGSVLFCKANKRRFRVGPFDVLSVSELRARALELKKAFDEARTKAGDASSGPLPGLRFANQAGDVRDLHRDPNNAGAVFQVASQFNCLEMTGPNVTPRHGVTRYRGDPTQGPACALSCPGGTVFRNYFAGADNQGQADVQINTLAGVEAKLAQGPPTARSAAGADAKTGGAKACTGSRPNPTRNFRFWNMENGYTMTTKHKLLALNQRLMDATLREQLVGLIRIGCHWSVDVEGCKHQVVQLYCSACPVLYNRSIPDSVWAPFAQLVLSAAYEATLAAATVMAFASRSPFAPSKRIRVYLTSLGGGAFGNDPKWIAAAIARSLSIFKTMPLDVRLVHYRQNTRDAYLLQLEKDF